MMRVWINSGWRNLSQCQACRPALTASQRRPFSISGNHGVDEALRNFQRGTRPFSGPGDGVDELIAQNKAWVNSVNLKDPGFFKKLAGGQEPRYLWIGCSDSRTPPETLSGMEPGTLFVHRNVGNLVSNIDNNCLSAIQYAVQYLKVQHIVVCGHYQCGAIGAAMQNVDHKSPLENWLRTIRDVYRLHREELDAIDDPQLRYDRLVEVNVIEQAINLYKTQVVQERRVETFKNLDKYGFVQPRIHPMIHDLHTGLLRRLDERMRDQVESLAPIYNMYSTDADDDMQMKDFIGMGSSIMTPDQMENFPSFKN